MISVGMLVILAPIIDTILNTTDIMARITVISHAQPLAVNNPQANPNHAIPKAIAADETI
jgi:hypothetical protein